MTKHIPSTILIHSFLVIWFGHLILDFMIGVWPVYKILACLDLSKAGLIAGCGVLMGELSQLGFGILSSRGHGRKLVLAGILLSSLISLLAYTGSYLFLFLIMVSAYLGSGAFHPAAAGMVVNWSSSRKSLFLALFASGGMLGTAISQALFTTCYTKFDGHTAIFLVPAILIGIACYLHPFPTASHIQAPLNRANLFHWLKPIKLQVTLLYSTQLCMQIVLLIFIFLMPDILTKKGYESWFSLGGGFFWYISGAAFTIIPIGYLADKYTHRQVLLVLIALSSLTMTTFLFSHSLSILTVSILLFILGISSGSINPLITSAGNKLAPAHTSMMSALLMGGATGIASLGLFGVGVLTSIYGAEFALDIPKGLLALYAVIFTLIYHFEPQKAEIKPA